jgi:uncharacterized protein
MTIDTFKVLITHSRSTPAIFQMSKLAISTICFVVSNLGLVSDPAMSVVKIGQERVTTNNSLVNAPLQQVATKPSGDIEDPIFDDVVLNRVTKLKQFLDRGGNPDRYFHAAINAGSIDCTKVMLARGANVNLAGDEGVTPLMTAARVTYRGGVEMTALLIKNGANVNARASKGSTALMYASWGVAAHYQDEYVEVVRLLIEHGAKVNVKNKMGDTPLSIAKGGKWQKIVAILKKAGARS